MPLPRPPLERLSPRFQSELRQARAWSFPEPLSFSAVLSLQAQLVRQRQAGEIPNTLLFLEHLPVFTCGRGLQWQGGSQPAPLEPAPVGSVPNFYIERGGGWTYHGPGQWVVYPIVTVTDRDLDAWIRTLEDSLAWVLRETYGLVTHSEPGASGLWLGPQKLASLGIALKRWVSFHGLALNGTNDLKPFFAIHPCGKSPEILTRIKDWLPSEALKHWRQKLEQTWCEGWGCTLEPYPCPPIKKSSDKN